jgi:hypothetical protein
LKSPLALDPNKITKESGEMYATLLDWRCKGDYSDFFDLEKDDAQATFCGDGLSEGHMN